METAKILDVLVTEGHLTVDADRLREFCQRWRVSELALFGSALRDDFGPTSDLDFLVTFQSNAKWSLWDLGDMQDELENWFGRGVDIVQVENLRNPIAATGLLVIGWSLRAGM